MNIRHCLNKSPLALLVSRAATWLGLAATLILVLAAAKGAQAQNNNSAPRNPYSQTAPGVNQSGQPVTAPDGTMQTPTSGTIGAQPLSVQGSGVPSTAMLYPDPTQYVLSAGDLISVRLFAAADYVAVVRISKDGTVQLPLIGSVNLAGITIRQAEDLIATSLKTAGMYRNPEVTIGLAESSAPQTIAFAGEKNGLFVVQGQRSLLDVLAATGGLPANASRTISIIRPGVDTPILVNLGSTPQELAKANIPILPKDTIFVERTGAVYLLGAFRQQGLYTLGTTGLTLMQAASLAGGPTFAGKYADLRIVRTVGSERTEVKVDIKRIMFGKDPDPILQAGDIVFLPTTPLKQALAAGGLGTLLSAVSVLLIAAYQR